MATKNAAQELCESFLDGNREYVISLLSHLGPISAALLVAKMMNYFTKSSDRASFQQFLEEYVKNFDSKRP